MFKFKKLSTQPGETPVYRVLDAERGHIGYVARTRVGKWKPLRVDLTRVGTAEWDTRRVAAEILELAT